MVIDDNLNKNNNNVINMNSYTQQRTRTTATTAAATITTTTTTTTTTINKNNKNENIYSHPYTLLPTILRFIFHSLPTNLHSVWLTLLVFKTWYGLCFCASVTSWDWDIIFILKAMPNTWCKVWHLQYPSTSWLKGIQRGLRVNLNGEKEVRITTDSVVVSPKITSVLICDALHC